MCAIAGIIDWNASGSLEAQLNQMLAIAVHRGRDGHGTYCSNGIHLGHNRLAIIDLSAAAQQPFLADSTVVVFNGAIYNYIELRKELIELGYTFTTQSDTEVIAVAYRAWGTACVKRFNGMWSFALHDQSSNQLFCSVDRFGVKPFHYTNYNGRFYFASEIKQLLTQVPAVANYKVLATYLCFHLENYNAATFFQNINRLSGGTNLLIDLQTGAVKQERYFDLSNEKAITEAGSIEFQFNQLAEKAVALRLRSDVKVGACLSGGIDSSYLLTQIKKQSNTANFDLFTAAVAERSLDDSFYAKQLVNQSQFAYKHHIVQPQKAQFLNTLKEVFHCQEEPFNSPSVFMQYFIMEEASKQGVKVLIDGQGADEFLLGYDRYLPFYINQAHGINRVLRFQKALQKTAMPIKELAAFEWLFTNADRRLQRLLSKQSAMVEEYKQLAESGFISSQANDYASLTNFPITEIAHTQLPKLLRYEDRNSMHFGIETRLPFLDKDWAVYNFKLPLDWKINQGETKFILRQALRSQNLNTIANRKRKIGFAAPESDWLSDPSFMYTKIAASAILKRIYSHLPDYQHDRGICWKLYSIAMWEETMEVLS